MHCFLYRRPQLFITLSSLSYAPPPPFFYPFSLLVQEHLFYPPARAFIHFEPIKFHLFKGPTMPSIASKPSNRLSGAQYLFKPYPKTAPAKGKCRSFKLPTRECLDSVLQGIPGYEPPTLNGTPIRMHELLEAIWHHSVPTERERGRNEEESMQYWSKIGTWMGIGNELRQIDGRWQLVCDHQSAKTIRQAYLSYFHKPTLHPTCATKGSLMKEIQNYVEAPLYNWIRATGTRWSKDDALICGSP